MIEPRCPVVEFNHNPSCELCPLYEGCHSVCIPTRPWRPLALPGSSGEGLEAQSMTSDHALLVVGEAPGSKEDMANECHIGPAGTYLDHIYIRGMGLQGLADVFLANAVRCRPPQNATPTTTQVRACLPYLVDDIRMLQSIYDKVTILCTGAVASRAVLSLPQKKAFGSQGAEVHSIGTGKSRVELDRPVHVFSTYHPAMLLPGRDPSRVAYVKRHLQLLQDYLQEGTLFTVPQITYDIAPSPPTPFPSIVSLDIETYGILEDHPAQTVFHPRKSKYWDGVAAKDQIISVALSWRDDDGQIQSGIFDFSKTAHRGTLLWWLAAIRDSGSELLCMNTQFDVQYLRYCWPQCCRYLRPPMRLWDLAITNYLMEDSRPERSLKNLAPLYGVASYEGGFKRYSSAHDPDLRAYNVQDSSSTLQLEYTIQEDIKSAYPKTAKLSSLTRQWYSDLLWVLIGMSEAGSTFDVPRLEALSAHLTVRLRRIRRLYKSWFEEPIDGEGSQRGLIELFDGVVATWKLQDDPELELTKKTRRISTGEKNRQLLYEHVRPGSVAGHQLRLLGKFRAAQKLMSSYVRPLLMGRGKDQVDKAPTLILDRAHPSWYVVPAAFEGHAGEGGTNQARITCKQPALQTAPPEIKRCFSTRFCPGVRLHADYKQLELNIAAILSGDEAFMYDVAHFDIHLRTSRLVGEVLGMSGEGLEVWAKEWRQDAGKVQNFRNLYRGGAKTFQATLRTAGLEISLEACYQVDSVFRKRYRRLWEWQEELIDTAKSQGYIELPLLGQSRRFLGSARTVDRTYIQTIVNLPVQAIAACICESAQVKIDSELRQRQLQSIIVLNCYDSLDLECPRQEAELVTGLLQSTMPDPPYYQALQESLKRKLPLKIDIETIAERG